MAAGNQAAGGGKPQGAGYELGELQIAPPKRAQSGTQPVTTGPAQPPARPPAQSLAQNYAAKAQEAARAAQVQPAAAPPAAPKPEKGTGRRTSLDLGGDAGGPALELDLAPAKPGKAAGPAGPAAPPAFDYSAFGGKDLGDGFEDPTQTGPALELEQVDRSQGDRVKVNGGAKDAKAEAAKEAQKVEELAGFGDDPENIIECVKYAVHVAKRLIELKRGRNKVAQEVAGLEADHNAALVGMGQALMNIGTDPRLQGLRSKIAAVHDAYDKVSRADQTMSKTRTLNQQAVAAMDQEAVQLRQALTPYLEAEQRAVEAQKKADDELKRGQALQKRVELELRALSEAKAALDSPKGLELKAQLDERKNVVATLAVALEGTNNALGQARRELALKRGTLDALEDKKKKLIEQAKAKEAEVEQRAKAAEGTHSAALRALAETAREQALQPLVEEQFTLVADVESVLADARKALNRYEKALELYDRDSVYKGVGVVGFVIALLVVALTVAS